MTDGYFPQSLCQIRSVSLWDEVKDVLNKNKDVVNNKIHAKSIPTLIYDGGKHNGLYKN